MSSSINFSSIGAPTAGYLGTDWVTYPMVITAVTTNPTKGTVVTDIAQYRRVGDSIELRYNYVQSSAGTGGSGIYLFSLPTGLVIDTTKAIASTTTNAYIYGNGQYSNTSPNGLNPNTFPLQVNVYDSTHLSLSVIHQNSTALDDWTGNKVGSSSYGLSNANAGYTFTALLPIVGYTAYGTMPITSPNAPISIGKNYLTSIVASTASGVANTGNGNFELGTTAGFTLAHSALTSLIPSSVGSSGVPFSASAGGSSASGNLSIGVVSSGQLAGSYSGSLASAAASTAGDMLISNAFYVDKEDQAKMMQISFNYSAASGASNLNFSGTSSNSFAVYIYDVTNAAWIQPAGVYNLVQGTGVGKCTATFQTTSNSTQYQLALVNINASAGAYTLYLDDLNIGPQLIATGPAMTDFSSVILTFNNMGSPTQQLFIKRIGDSAVIRGTFTPTTSGAASTASVSLPSYLKIDSSKMTTVSQAQIVGQIFSTLTTSGNTYTQYVAMFFDGSDTANLYFSLQTGSGVLSKGNGNSLVISGNPQSFELTIPILGWSSNTSMSTDTDTRVCAAIIEGTPAGSTANTPIIFPTKIQDTHAAYNATTGQFTAPISGFYQVSASTGSAQYGGTTNLYCYVAGTQYAVMGMGQSSGNMVGSTLVYALAGQTIDVRAGVTASSAIVPSTLSINRLSGPAVVAATETVKAKYFLSANAASTANVQINFNSKVYDSHGSVTTGASAWKFTAPISGLYTIKFNMASSGGSGNAMLVYKNGSFYQYIGGIISSGTTLFAGNADIQLNAGDYIDLRCSSSDPTFLGGSTLSTLGTLVCEVSILRVGN